jgi:hypothetical protein
MKNVRENLGIAGQWLAVVLLALGIFVEVRYIADLGFYCITFGSFAFAIFTKLRYYTKKK